MSGGASYPEVVLIGDLLMDYQYWVANYPKPGGDEAILESASNAGGSAANTAAALRVAGVSCALMSRVGDDTAGKELLERMSGIGVDVSCLDIHGGTGYTITMVERGGERTMFSYRNAAGYRPKLNGGARELLERCGLLCVSGYMLQEEAQADFILEAAKLAQEAGHVVALDPSPVIGQINQEAVRALLRHTDIILPNRDELAALAGDSDLDKGLRVLLKKVPCVAVKLGAQGSRLAARLSFCGAESCAAPAQEIPPVDTTGAGDSFNAGFIAAYLRGGPPEGWLKNGNRLAALAIARKGA